VSNQAVQLTEEAAIPAGANAYINVYADILRSQLKNMADAFWKPTAQKSLRRFTSGEVAKLLGITDTRVRQLSIEGNGPQPEVAPNGRRSYSLADIHALRAHLDATTNTGKRFSPRRSADEHLQVLAVTNFKGGSAKTTSAAHLAQYLVLRGYRVLAIDLDPQASLSALHGIQPEIDVGPNDTVYAALRYDEEQRRPLAEVIRPTYFSGLDIVPAHLELMEYEHETPKALAEGRRDGLFFARLQDAILTVADNYDVVIVDCPPQLGYLTLAALTAATSIVVTVHPQMLDVASMSQFLTMTGGLLDVIQNAGAVIHYDAMRFLLTRYEVQDGPQTRIAALLRNLFGEAVLTNVMVKSAAVSDAGLTQSTLYEVVRETMNRATYDRALESMNAVNSEIEAIIRQAWGRAA